MSTKSKSSARPRIACEISADRVLAGKLAETGGLVDECAVRELPPGSVVPDLTETNILQPEVVRKAINDAVGSVAGRLRDIVGILPDAAVRVVLLDFDTLPPNPVEAEGVVRFRLKSLCRSTWTRPRFRITCSSPWVGCGWSPRSPCRA